jgi:hypothetical protein
MLWKAGKALVSSGILYFVLILFLIGKGGFLILVDSLNKRPDSADALHTFFNQNAHNFVLVASQVDLMRRQDTPLFNLAEVTPEQAASYLAEVVGRDVYSELPHEARVLARNPQDLDFGRCRGKSQLAIHLAASTIGETGPRLSMTAP